MVEFKWIQISLFLIAVLQFTAAAEELPPSSFTVRAGEEVTLPCEYVIDDQQNCDSTVWFFSYLSQRAAVQLFRLGQIGEHGKSKSDRLSVTQNCSLVIKKVTDEDVGLYTCRQFKSGQQQGPDSVVYLSVVTMTEHKNNDQVVLNCSVSTYERCPHTVKWLFNGNNVDKDHKDLQTSQSDCSASVTFQSSLFIHTSNSNLLKCEVTDGNKVQHLFPFRLQPSGEKPGDDTRTRKPKPKHTKRTKPPPPTTTTTTTTTTTESSMTRGTITTASAINDDSTNLKGWWWIIVALAVAAALLIIVVAVIRWKRTKGKNTQTDKNIGRSLNPAVTPETSQDTADPEGGVSYASVNFTKKPNSKGRVQGQDDDDDDAVTYTTVKASSSSAGPSADSHVLYATINKPNK